MFNYDQAYLTRDIDLQENRHVRTKEQRPKVVFFAVFPLETFPNATLARQAQSGRNKTK